MRVKWGFGVFLALVIVSFEVTFPQTATAGTKDFVADRQTYTVAWGEARRYSLGPAKFAAYIYRNGKTPGGATTSTLIASIPLEADQIEITVARKIVGSSDAVILGRVSGSGGFLNYQVFTVRNGGVVCLLDRGNVQLHNGVVKVRGKTIVEYKNGRQVRTWKFN